VDGLYQRERDILDPTSNGGRLGLNDPNGRLNAVERAELRFSTVVGSVGDCDAFHDFAQSLADTEGRILLISGYCHSHGGIFLEVASARIGKTAKFKRQMGRAAGVNYGDLKPASEAWRHRVKVDQIVKRFLDALRSKDRNKLLLQIGSFPNEKHELLRLLLSDRRSVFSELRSGTGDPQRINLLWRDDEPSDENDDTTPIVCFCRESDCTGRWPIAQFDADNLPSRPYACMQVWADTGDINVPIEKYGLIEP
jgi:hypothetical protein